MSSLLCLPPLPATFSITSPLPSCFISPSSLNPPSTPSSASLLAGGLTEFYLRKAEPSSKAELYPASLSKYKNTIDAQGGWSPFPGPLSRLGDRCQETRVLSAQRGNALCTGSPSGGRGHRWLSAWRRRGRATHR